MPELSVVIPCFNEEAVLPRLVDRLVPVLEQSGCSWEVVLVNDGSQDRTWAVMASLRARDDRFTLVDLSRNFGHQLAITAGMRHALGDAIVVMDADLQDPPEVLLEMVERWREGYDVVHGIRTVRHDESLFKRSTAAAFYRVLQALSPIPMQVDSGDFRLMSRRAVDALDAMPERARYVRGMVSWLGFNQTGVTFERQARAAGETKYPLRKMLAIAADGIVSFSTVPLRLATTLGMFLALAALAYFVYVIAMKLVVGNPIHGWTSIVAVVVLIGSAQLLCLGIIGEYVGRVYEEVKKRPLFLTNRVEQGPAEARVPRPWFGEARQRAAGGRPVELVEAERDLEER